MLPNWGFSHPPFTAAQLAGHYAHPKKDTFQSKALGTGLGIKMWITFTSAVSGHTSSWHFANISHCKQLLLWWGGLCRALMWVIKEVEARSLTLSQQVLCKNSLTTLKWQLLDQSNRIENHPTIGQASTEESFEWNKNHSSEHLSQTERRKDLLQFWGCIC